MKRFHAAAVLLAAALLTGCAAQSAAEQAPVWQTDLPETGVHMELSGAELVSDGPVYYAPTREDAFYGRMGSMSGVIADGTPTVTFYGVTADQISLVYLESIGDLYVDYDRVYPQERLDYILTQTDEGVSYKIDTAYNFEFAVTTEQGSDRYLVVSQRSELQ